MNAWLWDDVVARPGWQQMAIDRALAECAARDGTTVFRLYRWQGDSLSFGANEAARTTWDREALERHQLPCVRRPTGGRGVWHGAADLTYSVTAPIARLGPLALAYRTIHEQLAGALRRLRLAAELAPALRRPTLDPGACFDMSVGGEVLVDGRKTIGSAQAVIGQALLQHGAIARADRSPELARFRLVTPAVPLAPALPDLPPVESVAAAVLTSWRDQGALPIPAELARQAERESAAHASRLQDPAWTWRR